MDKDFYIANIEKSAGIQDNVISTLGSSKAYLSALGAGAGALGGAYLFSDKDDKSKIKDVYKDYRSNKKEFNKNHKFSKKALRGVGALTGTALALKNGKSLGKAIGDGGLAGIAVGDMIGATALPVKELYSRHRKEFGTNPDAKMVGKVLGANALPNAAIWAGMYGIKNGAIKKGISGNINEGISNAIGGANEFAEIYNKFNGNPDLINSVGTKVVEKQISGAINKGLIGAASVPMALMPLGFARNSIASIPGAYINPKSLIEKKKEIENKSVNNEG